MSYITKILFLTVYVCVLCAAEINLKKNNTTSPYVIVPCTKNSDCAYLNGTCVQKRCYCNNSTFCKEVGVIKVNILGKKCSNTADCHMPHTICKNSTCDCNDTFVASPNNRTCLKVSTGLMGECSEDVQCYSLTPSSICQENKCACQAHMHDLGGSCYKNVELGEACALREECSLNAFSSCRNGICSCIDNYISNKLTCLPKATGINSTCSEDIQCTSQLGEGSICQNGYCKCQALYQLKQPANQCVRDILLEAPCQDDEDCIENRDESERLMCFGGQCKCRSMYIEENGYCLYDGGSGATNVLSSMLITFLPIILIT